MQPRGRLGLPAADLSACPKSAVGGAGDRHDWVVADAIAGKVSSQAAKAIIRSGRRNAWLGPNEPAADDIPRQTSPAQFSH